MQSKLTAMALALAFATVTALPAMAAEAVQDSSISNKNFQVEVKGMYDKGVEGRIVAPTGVGGQPDDNLVGTTAIDIDKALLGESLGLGAGLPTLPTASQGGVALRGGNVMQQLGDDGQRPAGVGTSSNALLPAVRIAPSAAAGRSLQAAPAIQAMPPTQGIQGQKVAPITKTLR